MLGRADNPVKMRQLLIQQGLAAEGVLAFDEADLQHLYAKGSRTPSMLARANVALLKETPPLPCVLIIVLLEKCKPNALGWHR